MINGHTNQLSSTKSILQYTLYNLKPELLKKTKKEEKPFLSSGILTNFADEPNL